MTADADGRITRNQGPPWLADAVCRADGYPTEFFTDLAPAADVDQAIEVCVRCPVRWDCLAWAIEREDRLAALTGEAPDRSYIYGGYGPADREWLSIALATARADGIADSPTEWLASVAATVLGH